METEYTEILEKLDELEKHLMEYDRSIQEDNTNTDLVHIIFRTAHNLKSSLAILEKNYSSNIIHSLETNFDKIRHCALKPSRALIDSSFTAIDIIRKNLSAQEEDKGNSELISEELNGLSINTDKGFETNIPKNTRTIPLNSYEYNMLSLELSKDKKLYQVEKLMTSDISREDYEELPIFQDIAEAGTLISVLPRYSDINKDNPELIMKILFTSDKSKEELSMLIFDPFREVSVEAFSRALPDKLRILIVEDDFISRKLLSRMLNKYGICDIAVDGNEAVKAFALSIEDKSPYDLICLDIMLPNMDGQEVLRSIRKIEKEKSIFGLSRTKILMTTALDDSSNIFSAFRHQADGYLVKPITINTIQEQLVKLGLI